MFRVVSIFLLCLLLAACGSDSSSYSTTPAAVQTSPPNPPSGSSDNVQNHRGAANRPALTPPAAAQMYHMHLSWGPRASRENGDTLPLGEIASYLVVGFMENSNRYLDNPEIQVRIDDGGATEHILEVYAPGTYHLAMAAVDHNGLQSELSNIVEVRVQRPPSLAGPRQKRQKS